MSEGGPVSVTAPRGAFMRAHTAAITELNRQRKQLDRHMGNPGYTEAHVRKIAQLKAFLVAVEEVIPEVQRIKPDPRIKGAKRRRRRRDPPAE